MPSARRALTTIALAATAFAGVMVTAESNASADVRVHVGGRAHVRIGGGVRVRPPRVRWVRVRRPPPPPLRVHVGGAIWVGGGYYGPRFSAPPPDPAYCDCGPGNYYPVQPAPAPYVAVAAPAPRPPLPRWGIGVGAGGIDVDGDDAGSDLALLGHYRLTPGLIIEGEIGKNEYAEGTRVDRRLGASLIYEFGAYNRFAPYLVGGLGVAQVNVGDGEYETRQNFGEVGIGLRLALSRRIHVAADVRAGSRSATDEAQPLDAQLRSVTPTPDESEDYTRARLSAVLHF